jgi:flagellin
MRINTNVASLNSMEAATQTSKNLASSLEKLSSGLRINKAADDASGLAIADKLRTQASSLKSAIDNANNGVAMLQIADKALGEGSNILDIIKTKLIAASTATTSSAGRESIRKDVDKLLSQISNIGSQTNYNGITLLQNSATDSAKVSLEKDFLVGESSTNIISIGKDVQANTTGLGLSGLKSLAANGLSASGAQGFLSNIDSALDTLNGWRSDFGSTQNQLDSAIRNLSTSFTNIKNAESIIRDTDFASESANFNKQNIIAQAGTYAMSQANQVQQNVLRLLQ